MSIYRSRFLSRKTDSLYALRLDLAIRGQNALAINAHKKYVCVNGNDVLREGYQHATQLFQAGLHPTLDEYSELPQAPIPSWNTQAT